MHIILLLSPLISCHLSIVHYHYTGKNHTYQSTDCLIFLQLTLPGIGPKMTHL